MKTINVTFEDNEMEQLEKKKDDKSWHDFIMRLTKIHQFDDIEEDGVEY